MFGGPADENGSAETPIASSARLEAKDFRMYVPGWVTFTAAAFILSLGAVYPNAAEPEPSGGQSQLELIAAIPLDQAFKEGGISLPSGPFSSWTPYQQRSTPLVLQKICAGFWTFINGADGPTTSRLLPASVTGADEVRLVIDICLVGHMPADWPERGRRLQSATSILNRADQAGSSLHLPAQLSR